MQTLTREQQELLHREIRDRRPDVWEPACRRLGELAGQQQDAYAALCDLLLASIPELRLRGLVALRSLAPSKPEQVLAFLNSRLEELRKRSDPVLLDALLPVYAALPEELGQSVVEGFLEDPNEEIRAASAAALPLWPSWPAGTLSKLAQDSSVSVKAGLLTALHHLQDGAEKQSVLDALRAENQPVLRGLLEEFQESPRGENPAESWPEPPQERRVAHIFELDHLGPEELQRVERALDRDPESALRGIREALARVEVVPLLALSDLTRELSLAQLLRTWSRMREGAGDQECSLWLLQTLGLLSESSEGDDLLEPLRHFLRACYSASEVENADSLLAWCCAHQMNAATLAVWNPGGLEGLSLSARAQKLLTEMAEKGAGFQERSLFQLSHFDQELQRLGEKIVRDCPRPERYVLEAVVQVWRSVLERETESMMGGQGS